MEKLIILLKITQLIIGEGGVQIGIVWLKVYLLATTTHCYLYTFCLPFCLTEVTTEIWSVNCIAFTTVKST